MPDATPDAAYYKDAEAGTGALDVADADRLHRLSTNSARAEYRGREEAYTAPVAQSRNPIVRFLTWYSRWGLAGLGMFSEAYIIFSLGQIKPFQNKMFPDCFKTFVTCNESIVNSQSYIQICGIIAGMLFWGFAADIIGRKWGSRIVASIMLSGCILLTFTPFANSSGTSYLNFFIVAETWYGFGVGGEYPLASSSAAERAQANPELEHLRGREVVLTFSGQGLGNFVNACVILISMAIFGQTGALTFDGSRNVMSLQFGIGAFVCVLMVAYRAIYLRESEVWAAERKDFEGLASREKKTAWDLYIHSIGKFWPRLIATTMGWVANDFAFYGNKLFQNTFITALFPTATTYEKQKWTILNNFVALTGYYFAAWLIDYPWYGRRRMQNVGFIMMFILFIICAGAYPQLTGSTSGLHAFQFLYFFSSFWNQFGPNCTTWLVAGEVYPTDVRATYHGISAAMGKVGAIIANVVFGYVNQRTTFYLSAAFGLFGAAVTYIFLPDTTGLTLDEIDRMYKYSLAGELEHYHGEAINPKHLSPWERLMKWQRHYDPALDAKHKEVQALSPKEELAINEQTASFRETLSQSSSARYRAAGRPAGTNDVAMT